MGTAPNEGGATFVHYVGAVSVFFLLVTTVTRDPSTALCGLVVGVPAGALILQVVAAFHAFVYHSVAKLLGGSTTFESSLTASYYASVTRLPVALFRFAVHLVAGAIDVPLLVVVGAALSLVLELWFPVLLAGHARGQHELSPGRAWIAGVAPVVVSFTLGTLAMIWWVSTVGDAFGLSREQLVRLGVVSLTQ